MPTAIKMPLRSLSPAVVRDLQEKYPDAEISVVPKAAGAMNENRFWEIIALLDWSKAGNDDAVIEPAVRALEKLPEAAILSFYDLLSEKLYLLDSRENAEHSENSSADLFLYARCGVVANGREFYEKVLKKPSTFPKGRYFESLLDIPERSWFRKTGQDLEHLPKYIYETGFNPNGWGADTISF
jgi:hypothetical protein